MDVIYTVLLVRFICITVTNRYAVVKLNVSNIMRNVISVRLLCPFRARVCRRCYVALLVLEHTLSHQASFNFTKYQVPELQEEFPKLFSEILSQEKVQQALPLSLTMNLKLLPTNKENTENGKNKAKLK